MLPPDRTKVQVLSTGQVLTLLLGPAASTLFLSASESDLVDGETYDFYIEQADDWEHSYGVYDASVGTITRTVIKSKIGGTVSSSAMIDLDGTAYLYFPLFQRLFAAVAATGDYYDLTNHPIIKLDQDTIFYIDTVNGDDANDGRTPGAPWKTAQHAAAMMAYVNAGGFKVTIQFVAQTIHTATSGIQNGYTLARFRHRPVNCDTFTIVGDIDTPANVTIDIDTNGTCYVFIVEAGCVIEQIRGFCYDSSINDGPTNAWYTQWHVPVAVWDGGNTAINNSVFKDVSVCCSLYGNGFIDIYDNLIATNFGAFADIWGRGNHLRFRNEGTTTLDPSINDMDDFVWCNHGSICDFGNHNFVNPYVPLGYRWWAGGGGRIYRGTAVVPGMRGGRGPLWYYNDYERSDNGVVALSGPTDFYVDPNGRDGGDGMGDVMGGQPISAQPQFAWATLEHAADVLSRVNANGHRVRLYISDGIYEWGAKGYGGSVNVYWKRPINCDRFEIIGNPGNPYACTMFRNTSEWGYLWAYGNNYTALDYDHESTEIHGVDNIEGFYFKTVAPNDWIVCQMWWDNGWKYFRNCVFDNSFNNCAAIWTSLSSAGFRGNVAIVGSSYGLGNSLSYFTDGPANFGSCTFNVSVQCGDGGTAFAYNAAANSRTSADNNTVFQNQSNWNGKSWRVSNFSRMDRYGKTWPGTGVGEAYNSLVDGVWYTSYNQ